MNLRIVPILLLIAAIAFAKAPSSRPTQGSAPAAAPATRPVAKSSVARDIIAKYNEQKKKEQEQLKVAFIDLDRAVAERPPLFSLFGDNSLTLQSVLAHLAKARDNKDCRAVLLNLGETEFNLAQAQELRDALSDLRKAGKRSFVFADAYDTRAYIAASGASDICMMSGGEIEIPGVGMETMFAKGLLDKIGVKADYVQIGQYKGADEEYTRTEPSKELRGELNKILDSMYEQIVNGIAYHRNISRDDVIDAINGVMVSAKVAKERKFVDHLVNQDGLRDLMKKELGRDVNVVAGYGLAEREPLDITNPMSLVSALFKKHSPAEESGKPQIAIIYVDGVIVDGESGDDLFGGGNIGSEDLRKAFRIASRDENVKAIVLRIDSPGGSAMASEVMWQAARRLAKNKPLIISVGGMAASGGYYVASAGQYIFADSNAIVGSIGVVGGKFVLHDLFDKIGLHTETFIRGTNADLFSMAHPFTDQQRRLVTNWMQQTYEQFVDRVMTTRKDKIKDIDDVAHGRIFLAKQAKALGMVDELGGLNKAIAYAASKANLAEGKYDLRIVPGTKTLGDLLRGTEPDAPRPSIPRSAWPTCRCSMRCPS